MKNHAISHLTSEERLQNQFHNEVITRIQELYSISHHHKIAISRRLFADLSAKEKQSLLQHLNEEIELHGMYFRGELKGYLAEVSPHHTVATTIRFAMQNCESVKFQRISLQENIQKMVSGTRSLYQSFFRRKPNTPAVDNYPCSEKGLE